MANSKKTPGKKTTPKLAKSSVAAKLIKTAPKPGQTGAEEEQEAAVARYASPGQ